MSQNMLTETFCNSFLLNRIVITCFAQAKAENSVPNTFHFPAIFQYVLHAFPAS